MGSPSTVVTRQFIRLPVTAFMRVLEINSVRWCARNVNPRKGPISDFLLDPPYTVNFAYYVFYTPLPNRYEYFLYFFAGNVGYLMIRISKKIQKHIYLAGKNKKMLTVRQGHRKHVCKISRYISRKWRGHRVENEWISG